jgi:hypothetical protein
MFKTIATTALFTASLFAQFPDMELKVKAELDSQMHLVSSSLSPGPTVSGAPYSAEETTTTTQMLFDGNRIVNTSTAKVFRDQQGRTRVERNLNNIGTLAAGVPSVSIVINDPVAGVHYNLQPQSKTGFKAALQTRGASPDITEAMRKLKLLAEDKEKARTVKGNPGPGTPIFEDLGDSDMAGVPVKGSRTTRVIPAGSTGNDRDISIVDERWYSSDLKINVMTRHSDPRSGETVFQVTNLTRSNPDSSFFQVPADYQIQEIKQDVIKVSKEE